MQKLDDLLLNLVVVFEARRIKGVTPLRAAEAAKHMAVASGRAGRVLARPLFRRLNVHMRTLNTCQAEPSGKMAAGIIVQISPTKR